MESVAKPASGSAAGKLVMLLSVVVVGGFLYWLSATSEPTQVAVAEPDAAEYNEVPFAQFSASPEAYRGQEVMLRAVPVVSPMGSQAFFTNLADAQNTPFLLHLSAGLVADSVTVAVGDSVDVAGVVLAMSDSVVSAWELAGAIANDGERSLALFAEHFVEILSVDGVEAAGTSDSSESPEPSS